VNGARSISVSSVYLLLNSEAGSIARMTRVSSRVFRVFRGYISRRGGRAAVTATSDRVDRGFVRLNEHYAEPCAGASRRGFEFCLGVSGWLMSVLRSLSLVVRRQSTRRFYGKRRECVIRRSLADNSREVLRAWIATRGCM